MPDLIDKAQLQATAQVAKSYILDQDTANVNTIINALQSSGGTKTEPTLTVGSFSVTTQMNNETRVCSIYLANITYNGDGDFYVNIHSPLNPPVGAMVNNNILHVFVPRSGDVELPDAISGTLYATEGLNYAAKSTNFTIYNN